jgi:hypothetical protein
MVDVSTWSETPGSNTTVDGTSIAEACSPGNLNNAIRSVMAGVKTFHIAYSTTAASLAADYMPKAAGTFSGTQPKYTGEGAVLHNYSSSGTSGKVFRIPVGDPDPTTADGDWVFYYTP